MGLRTEPARGSDLYNYLYYSYSKQQIERMISNLSMVLRDKYRSNRSSTPKYGNLSRAMKYEQIIKFFSHIRNPEIKYAFLLQFFYALRVSELSSIELFLEQGYIRIENKKCNRVEFLPLFEPVKYFFTHLPTPTPNYLRKAFKSIRRDAELEFIYGKSTNEKQLYLFSTHSLRHTAINIFGDYVRDPFKVNIFSRHQKTKDIGVMGTYRHYDMDKLRNDLTNAFEKYFILLKL